MPALIRTSAPRTARALPPPGGTTTTLTRTLFRPHQGQQRPSHPRVPPGGTGRSSAFRGPLRKPWGRRPGAAHPPRLRSVGGQVSCDHLVLVSSERAEHLLLLGLRDREGIERPRQLGRDLVELLG